MTLKKILLTTDFSEHSRRAFLPAATLAKKFHAELHLVHVMETQPAVLYQTPTGAQTYSPESDLRLRVREILETTAKDPLLAGLAVKTHLLEGGAIHERLPRFQKEHHIDLTVISTHGRTGLGHFLLGSFAERVVRMARSPILVVRGDEAGESAAGREFAPKRILVPCDFSEPFDDVLEWVNQLARAYHSEVLLLHVMEPLPDLSVYPWEGIGLPQASAALNQKLLENGKVIRERLLDIGRRKLGTETRLEARVLVGAPTPELLHTAQEWKAELIVMATHGRTGLGHVFLGSVAERCVQRAPCSVLTIRPVSQDPVRPPSQ
jgi:nucleotide-binding universal stress UspA family protein